MKRGLRLTSLVVAVGVAALLTGQSYREMRRTQAADPYWYGIPDIKPEPGALTELFPSDSRQVFENSDHLFIYSIKKYPENNLKGTFHEYPILGKMEIKGPQLRAALVANLYERMAATTWGAACFSPYHAIRAVKGKKVLDLVVCFHCGGIHSYYQGALGYGRTARGEAGFFDALLKSGGVAVQ